MFRKEDRGSFKYWFAHWCAYQMTALNLGAWKWKYLFHDFEKPWMMLWKEKIIGLPKRYSYKMVQSWHRKHNRHHLEYEGSDGLDYEAMIIDWECSRFTKESSPLTALQEYQSIKGRFSEEEQKIFMSIFDKYNLKK